MIYKAPTFIKNQGASLAYSIGEWCLSGCICDDDVVWCLDVVCTDTHKTLEHIFKILPLKFLAVFLSDCCSSYSHQCMTGHAPVYLADDCQLAADASAGRLRSADTAKCVVRCTYNSFGDRCFFAAAGPRLWNTLPLNLRLCDSLGQFKRSLKTFLFGLWDHGALWH